METPDEHWGLVKDLREFTSSLAKEDVLAVRRSDLNDKLLQYAYDPFMTYKQKFPSVDMQKLGVINAEMFSLLDKLADRSLSGNAAIEKINEHVAKYGQGIKLICNKDLDCGISAITINKVYGKNFIPKFCIQLAMEEDINRITFPILAQLKYNGARVVVLIKDGDITFKSRGGHIFSFPRLAEHIKMLCTDKTNCMLDGELTLGDSQGTDHTDVSGLINSAIKGSPIPDRYFSLLQYNVFDYMPLGDFLNQKCVTKYKARFASVQSMLKLLPYVKGPIVVAKTWEVHSKEELLELYNSLLAKEYEGLILKKPDSLYTFKKNKTWIKMKSTDTADLFCANIIEGKGKYEGGIGSLICRGRVEGKEVEVSVGSGLTDLDRGRPSHYYVGKIIEVKYNKVITDSTTGLHSLFLPRFVCVRRDKS